MKLDPARSRLAIYTEAEGLFSALAHDLELAAEDLEGEASETSAELRLPPASIRVRGVTKRGKLETGILSAGDRETIERQIKEDILRGPPIVVRGAIDPKAPTRATMDVLARGATTHLTCDVAVAVEGETKRVQGRAEVSLAALGAPPVKGPMGAFRVKDRVRVEFDLVFG